MMQTSKEGSRRGRAACLGLVLAIAGCSATPSSETTATVDDGGRDGDVRAWCASAQARGAALGCEPSPSPEDAERGCDAIEESAAGCEANAIAYLRCAADVDDCETSTEVSCAVEWEGWDRCIDATDADVCYEVCARSHDQGCGLTSPECLGECLAIRGIAAVAGCSGELRAYDACLAALPDVCERSSCEPARMAFVRCGE